MERGFEVVEAEEVSSGGDGELVGAIEGEKPDAGGSVWGCDIGADICFGDVAVVWEGWESGEADVFHPEGDKADVGFSLEGLEFESFWDEGANEVRVECAVEECEVSPALAHDWLLVRSGAEGFKIGERDLFDGVNYELFERLGKSATLISGAYMQIRVSNLIVSISFLAVAGCQTGKLESAPVVKQAPTSDPVVPASHEAQPFQQLAQQQREPSKMYVELIALKDNDLKFLETSRNLVRQAGPGSQSPYVAGQLPAFVDEFTEKEKSEIAEIYQRILRRRFGQYLVPDYGYYASIFAQLVGRDAIPALQLLTRDCRTHRASVLWKTPRDFGALIAQRIALGDVENALIDWEKTLDFSQDNVKGEWLATVMRPAWEFPDNDRVQAVTKRVLKQFEGATPLVSPEKQIIDELFGTDGGSLAFQSGAVREFVLDGLSQTQKTGVVFQIESNGFGEKRMRYKLGSYRGYYTHGMGRARSVPMSQEDENGIRKVSMSDIFLQLFSSNLARGFSMVDNEEFREKQRIKAILLLRDKRVRLDNTALMLQQPIFYPKP